MTGENSFIRMSADGGKTHTSRVSHWRVLWCPSGAGHAMFVQSPLTRNRVQIYSDNIAMTRWLQATVQGMLNPELADLSLPVIDADFTRSGDYRDFWTESLTSFDEEISLTWYSPGDPLLIHTDPKADPARPYGVCTVLVPVSGARLVINGIAAAGTPWPREREGRPFSTSALAFSESWTEAR